MLSAKDIKALVASGEGYNVDFKLRVPAKVRELSQEVCAFANSEGGYVLIGVDDSGRIVGTEIDNPKRSAIQDTIRDISPTLKVDIYQVDVDGKIVWVLDVPSGKDRPYVLSGSIYVRESANSQKLTTAEEIRSFFQRANKIFFDAIPCDDFNFDKEFDEENFDTFCLEAGITKNVPTHQILENLQVFEKSDEIKNGGVMFFCQASRKPFPTSNYSLCAF